MSPRRRGKAVLQGPLNKACHDHTADVSPSSLPRHPPFLQVPGSCVVAEDLSQGGPSWPMALQNAAGAPALSRAEGHTAASVVEDSGPFSFL